jgi:hypothetical protein
MRTLTLSLLACLALTADASAFGRGRFRGRSCAPCAPAACRVIPHGYHAPHAAPSTTYRAPQCPCGPRCQCAPRCECGPGCGQPERIPAPQACPGGKCPAVVPFVKMLPGCANGRCR